MAFFNPFCSEEALKQSNYCTLQQKSFTINEPIKGRKKETTEKIATKLSAFVEDLKKPDQPLLSGTAKKQSCFGVYTELGGFKATAGLCRDLARFIFEFKEGVSLNNTFMAVFITPSKLSKEEFNSKVNAQLELLKKAAEPFYCIPESIDPSLLNNSNLLLFGGKVLKVVSIYRNNSQGQLKFDYPMLAFSVQETEKLNSNPSDELQSAQL